jgi:anti-anti-sigma factor
MIDVSRVIAARSNSSPMENVMALIKHEVKGDVRVIVIDVVRLVDETAIEQCKREIVEVLDKTEESNVLLHFGQINFMSSAALGMLIRINKKCKEYNITLKLCSISSDILQVFKITSLDKIFDIHSDAAGAMESFKKAGKSFFRKPRPSSYEVT